MTCNLLHPSNIEKFGTLYPGPQRGPSRRLRGWDDPRSRDRAPVRIVPTGRRSPRAVGAGPRAARFGRDGARDPWSVVDGLACREWVLGLFVTSASSSLCLIDRELLWASGDKRWAVRGQPGRVVHPPSTVCPHGGAARHVHSMATRWEVIRSRWHADDAWP